MKLSKLTLQGFTCFKERTSIDFSNLQLFAICGDTGSGKSSLIDAMIYALYGRTPRLTRNISSLVSQGMEKMFVSLKFSVQGKDYKVTRILKQSKKTVSEALLAIQIDGEWSCLTTGIENTNAELEKIVGLTYEAFTKCIVLPQGQFQNFLQEHKERQEILIDLLGLDILPLMQAQANETYKTLSLQLQQVSEQYDQMEVDTSPEIIQTLKENIETLETSLQKIQEDSELNQKQQQQMQQQLKDIEKIQALQQQVQDLEQQSQQLQQQENKMKMAKQLQPLSSQIAQYHQLTKQIQGVQQQIQSQQQQEQELLQSIQQQTEKIQQTQQRYNQISDLEQQCHQLLNLVPIVQTQSQNQQQMQRVQQQIQQIQQQNEQIQQQIIKQQQMLSQQQQYVIQQQQQIEQAQQKAWQTYTQNITHALQQRLAIGQPCPVCQNIVHQFPEVVEPPQQENWQYYDHRTKQLQQQLQQLQQQLQQTQQQLTQQQSQQKQNQQTWKNLQQQMQMLQAQQNACQQEMQQCLQKIHIPSTQLNDTQQIHYQIQQYQQKIQQIHQNFSEQQTQQKLQQQQQVFIQKTIQDLQTRRNQIQEQYEPVQKSIQELLEQYKIATIQEVQQYIISPSQIQQWEQATLQTNVQLETMQQQLKEHQATQTQDVSYTTLQNNMQNLQTQYKTLQTQYKETFQQKLQIQQKIENIQQISEQKEQQKEKLQTLQTKTEIHRILKTTLQSNAFPKYISNEILKILCEDANQYLQILSETRYLLQTNQKEIIIQDNWNDQQTRTIKTLSGGETFLVSLALALALSQRITQIATTNKGHQQLECLFLDEGFDTLDEEHLSNVIQALKNLQNTGKTIGIISHLPILTNFFPQRIHISKTKQGSILYATS